MLLLSFRGVQAQERGDYYVGGIVGLSASGSTVTWSDSYSSDSETTIGANCSFGIEAGYFIDDRVKLGLGFSYSIQPKTGESISVSSLCGSIAYYKLLVKGLYYVPEFEIGGAWRNEVSSGVKLPLSGVGIALSLFQVEFKPTEHFSASVNLGYISLASISGATNYHNENISFGYNSFLATLGTSPLVRFKYYF